MRQSVAGGVAVGIAATIAAVPRVAHCEPPGAAAAGKALEALPPPSGTGTPGIPPALGVPTIPTGPALPAISAVPTLSDVPGAASAAKLSSALDRPLPHDLSSAGELALAVIPEEVKQLIPDPDKLAEWFQGHGGALLGTGTMVVAPLGNIAAGEKNGFFRSHLPSLGLHGQIGLLFLRRFGATLHGGYAKHLKGTDAQTAGSSWQIGMSALYLLKPEEKTPYLEFGLNRNSFSNTLATALGQADRTAASWDYRLGVGYMVLTKAKKFLCTPWVAVDLGKFSKVTQTLNGQDRELDLPGSETWH